MNNTQLAQVRWAIIYCPKQGVRRSQKRWEHIREILEKRGVEYDFVQSETPKSVNRLTKMMVNNGYKTLIIVGGDSAMNRALNGLVSMGEETCKSVALGIIPNGRGNDFASFWGYTEEDDEKTIDSLIRRRLRKVDVGYIRQTTSSNETDANDVNNEQFFLNCVNIGLVANIMKLKYKTRRILGLTTLSYFASMFLLLFQRLETKMRFRVNEEYVARKVMTVCIGNCRSYGQTPSAVPYNGMLDVTVVSHPGVAQLFEGMVMLFTGKFLNHKDVQAYRTSRAIRFEETHHATVSIDGKVLKNYHSPFEVGILPEHIDFIIPS